MANRRDKKEVDAEVDLHGMKVEQMRHALEGYWKGWRGMRCVRLIHGQGTALKPELQRWCDGLGLPYATDRGNEGAMLIFPRERMLPSHDLGTTLREKGLRLTPEEEAYLRDPAAVERARQEELCRKQEEHKRQLAEAAKRTLSRRQDEALWQAEMNRLDVMEKRRTGNAVGDAKPHAPVVIPPAEIKHQEGYWRSELVRVADTDTETLKKQKRTGLDKLAPPLEARKPDAPLQTRRSLPKRDIKADNALFEAEMARLMEKS